MSLSLEPSLVTPTARAARQSLQRWRTLARILGMIVALSALSKLPSLGYALLYESGTAWIFANSLMASTAAGCLLWWPNRHVAYDLRLRDGFLVVTLSWSAATLASAWPLMQAPLALGFSGAVFEVMSGLTTTGSTVISGLDDLPRSILLYRQVLQFVGGMGIVILAVAILPMLKVGGTQLFRAESTGPSRDTKLTPRIAGTAKALWLVYAGLTTLCALAYWIAGMDLFDAVGHALATTSTGGFSTHDAAFGEWDSPLIEGVAVLFMTLGGVNFALHFSAWRSASLQPYAEDSELRAYLRILLAVGALVGLVLLLSGHIPQAFDAFRFGLFMVVSVMTTTGFTPSDFHQWPPLAAMLVMIVGVIGGCSGSTVGGLKVARVQMAFRQGWREVRQLIHPRGQFLVTMGGQRVSESVVLSVGGFITLWMACFMLVLLAFVACGLDPLSAFGATVATIANVGPGLGEVTFTFATVGEPALWVGTVSMLLGRLEVFSILVLLTPMFWRE
ncbi:TrkH family potassium uptake protein [Pseudomarimonas salicorniae]|uniref:Trk system potassium uptake protein n=1 Tax=Pseudomarimonas salicorniae TaxID=2933270 RepID=A0ABT0GJP9_9GAMM|nr:potassium transporter TrkG [Lysobacter sp. CAU 1642]MCK7594240.1 potassium transporter [Lysobacter sp. CAU 1642]